MTCWFTPTQIKELAGSETAFKTFLACNRGNKRALRRTACKVALVADNQTVLPRKVRQYLLYHDQIAIRRNPCERVKAIARLEDYADQLDYGVAREIVSIAVFACHESEHIAALIAAAEFADLSLKIGFVLPGDAWGICLDILTKELGL